MSSIISLKERHSAATRELILNTAIGLLKDSGVSDLTVRAVAATAGMSERTVFRYFANRDEFLDAVAQRVIEEMDTPAPPASIDELLSLPDRLYRSFEKNRELVTAVLHTDIFNRVRAGVARGRWTTVRDLIDTYAPTRSEEQRRRASTNINYYLSATTWNYYRHSFELSARETIACAESAIRLMLEDLKVKKN